MSSASSLVQAAPARLSDDAAQQDSAAIIVAGGTGERFGHPGGKHLAPLCGLPLLAWSLLAFDRARSVRQLVVVCAEQARAAIEDEVLSQLSLTHEVAFAEGGATRQASVRSGLAELDGACELVAVHDAARPLIDEDLVEDVFSHLRSIPEAAGVACAARVVDTLKLVEGPTIISTPDRSFYWAVQTPQTFRVPALIAAHDDALLEGYEGTDDASLIERVGGRVDVHETPRSNIKVTYPEDLAIAEAILAGRLIS